MTAPANLVEPFDPRPRLDEVDFAVLGVRCVSCRHPMPTHCPVCVVCGGDVAPDRFGPEGTVYASTIVRISVGDWGPPYAMAYVDLDDGPRVLSHVDGDSDNSPAVSSRVRLVAPVNGDILMEVLA